MRGLARPLPLQTLSLGDHGNAIRCSRIEISEFNFFAVSLALAIHSSAHRPMCPLNIADGVKVGTVEYIGNS